MKRNEGKKRNKGDGLGKALLRQQQKQRYSKYIEETSSNSTYSNLVSSLQNNPNKSITQHANTLDEFLERAVLSNETYSDSNVAKIVSSNVEESFKGLISEEDSAEMQKNLFQFKHLPIPRRPDWRKILAKKRQPDVDKSEKDRNKKENKKQSIVNKSELHELEQASFIEWRRHIASLEERNRNLAVTPFEKNLEFWRQLWRVVEKSDVIVQVVDARNPLLFRCTDLEKYVQEVAAQQKSQTTNPSKKQGFLIINKADFLSEELREAWRDYFVDQGFCLFQR